MRMKFVMLLLIKSISVLECAEKCGLNKYCCRSGRCINETSYCDGINDCGDWGDELYCKSKFLC